MAWPPLEQGMGRTLGKSNGVGVQGIQPEIVRNRQRPDQTSRTGQPWPDAVESWDVPDEPTLLFEEDYSSVDADGSTQSLELPGLPAGRKLVSVSMKMVFATSSAPDWCGGQVWVDGDDFAPGTGGAPPPTDADGAVLGPVSAGASFPLGYTENTSATVFWKVYADHAPTANVWISARAMWLGPIASP